jgi:hypothetical protein
MQRMSAGTIAADAITINHSKTLIGLEKEERSATGKQMMGNTTTIASIKGK